MTEDLPRPRTRRARRLTLLAAGLVSLGLWTGAAGASDAAEATATATTSVELPGWNGEQVEGDAAALIARIAQAMGAGADADVDDTGNRWTGVGDVGNRWTGVGDVGNRWTGTPHTAGWGNRWAGRNS